MQNTQKHTGVSELIFHYSPLRVMLVTCRQVPSWTSNLVLSILSSWIKYSCINQMIGLYIFSEQNGHWPSVKSLLNYCWTLNLYHIYWIYIIDYTVSTKEQRRIVSTLRGTCEVMWDVLMRLRNKFKLQNQNFNTYIYEGAGSAEVSFIPVRVTTVITSLFLHAEVFTSLFLGCPQIYTKNKFCLY